MGIFLGLLWLALVLWVAWTCLKTDVKVESVSRDLEDTMINEAVDRVRQNLQTKVDQWKETK